MKVTRPHFASLALVALLVACGQPVPPDKLAYVGTWHEAAMDLSITKDGSVAYKRVKGGQTTSVEGPLKGFHGNDFEVGVGPAATTFVVSKPPYQDAGQWKMVVDDVTLVKSAE